MATEANESSSRIWLALRIAMWATAAILLLLPAIAMRFTAEVQWDETDFIAMGIMLTLACGTVELGLRASANGAYRLGVIIAVGTAFLTIWVNLAVGMIGSEDNPMNLMFGGVLLLALTGTLVARRDAGRMARAMTLTAIAQALGGAAGLSIDLRGAIFSMIFAAPWLLSAALFAKAARDQADSSRSGFSM